MSPANDLINFVYADYLESCLSARAGLHEEASALARMALTRADTTDYFFARAESRLFFAEALSLAGNAGEAATWAADGLAVLDEKGDLQGPHARASASLRSASR